MKKDNIIHHDFKSKDNFFYHKGEPPFCKTGIRLVLEMDKSYHDYIISKIIERGMIFDEDFFNEFIGLLLNNLMKNFSEMILEKYKEYHDGNSQEINK